MRRKIMKKIKTNLGIIGLSAFLMFFGITKVNAYNYSTGWLNGPSLTPGFTTATSVYDIRGNRGGIKAEDVRVYLTDIKELPTNYISSNDRNMWITVFEDDQYPNEDEQVSLYKWSFKNRTLSSAVVVHTESGNLDSADDDTVEIYLHFLMTKITGDPSTPTGKFFNYKINVT